MMRETYEETMKRLRDQEEQSNYWSFSAARHTQELERAGERTQQEELAGSMRAEAINSAPIDELKDEIEVRNFNDKCLVDIEVSLYNALDLIEIAIDENLNDETPIRVSTLVTIKKQLLTALNSHTKLGK